jgi:hypothetical protein
MKPIVGDAKPAAAAGSSSSSKSKGKKRTVRSDDEESDSGDGKANELIDVEFGIYDPRPVDYLTTKMILKDYVISTSSQSAEKKQKKLDKKKKSKGAAAAAAAEEDDDEDEDGDSKMAASSPPAPVADDFALHELCDAIVTQVSVGSMVKGEGTEEPLGFATVLSMAWEEKYAKNVSGGKVKWPEQLRAYIVSHAPAALRSTFQTALASQSTGLLIQGRLVNVPPQIVPQLHDELMEDVTWTRSNTGPYGSYFAFTQYLLIARKFKPAPGSQRTQQQDVLQKAQFIAPFQSGKKKQKKAAAAAATAHATSGEEEWEWLRFEEELYARAATAQFSFPCPFTAEDAAAGRQPQCCVVMLIPQSKVAGIVEELQAMAAIS